MNEMETAHKFEVVSSESEELILVDEQDREIGFLDKARAHDGEGSLHRAFSLFIFNDDGELLLQQRAAGKRLWPMFWSNSCCSHPRRGEEMDVAVHRRLDQELGMRSQLNYLYKFSYSAPFEDKGTERELCSVYIGRAITAPVVNRSEINALRWVAPDALDQELEATPAAFTPWFKMEWVKLRSEFRQQIETL